MSEECREKWSLISGGKCRERERERGRGSEMSVKAIDNKDKL